MLRVLLAAKLARITARSSVLFRYGLSASVPQDRRTLYTTFKKSFSSREFLVRNNEALIGLQFLKRCLASSTEPKKRQSSAPGTGRKSSEPNSSQPKFSPSRFFMVLISAGLTFLAGYMLTHDQPYILDMRNFMHLLERGEVKAVLLHPRGHYAIVKLHTTLPGAENKMIMLSVRPSAEQFEMSIRKQEDTWGIPENDRLPIHRGTPADFTSKRSPASFLNGAILLSALLATLILFIISKRGRIHSMKSPLQSSPRTFGAAATRREQPRAEERSSSDSAKSKASDQTSQSVEDSDKSGPGLPFSWDPFSGFQTIKPVTTNVKFQDVAGLHASKQEVMEFVAYLKNPQKYQALGAKLPKGALLLGPPGTGKTLLVKALANEAGVPFFSMAGSEFVEVIGGLGASRIRQLFRTARANPPAIIFIDELDSLGRRRSSVDTGGRRGGGPGGGGGGGGASEMEQTLNQLLVEMDGMDTAEGTIVFAATNRADLLDKALLRAGRFDRHIYIDLPNMAERKELIAMYMAKYRLSPTIIQSELIERLATWTPGMSGADIARLCNEAALVTARHSNYLEGVTQADFDVAFERILAGAAKKSNPLSPPERRVAAVQEAGRALIACLLPRTGLVPIKVSIVPRTLAGAEGSGGLGFTHMVPEERRLFNTEELRDRMAVLLGGRAAEQVIFNAVSDASQRYLRAASDLAMKQVREWGLSKVIGNLSFDNDPSGNEYTMKPYSQLTQNMIEMEAQQLVTSAFARCVELLQQNRDKLQLIIDALLKQEVLSYEELRRICQLETTAPTPDPVTGTK